MATSYYEEDSTGMPRLVKAPAPAPAPAGIINQAVAPTGFAGVQGAPAPAPAPVVSKPAPAPTAYAMGKDSKPLLQGDYLAAVGRGEIQDDRVTGFSAGPGTILARNNQGRLATNAIRIGSGSAAKQTAAGPTRGEIAAGAAQGGVPAPAPAPAPARPPAASGAGNWGGVQNSGTAPSPVAGPPTPGPSGQPNTRPFTPDGAGSSTTASGSTGFREWNVTAPQTVQQQAAGIIAADSPLMQQARGRAMQQMNERGLINSSLGVQAAQDAVMDRALQIAAPDAATNAQAAQFNANQGNAWNLAQQEMAQRDKQFAQDMEYKRWALSQNFENEKQLREVENKYRGELESDSGFQRQYNTYIDGIFQVDMNKDLDPETKLQMKKQLGQQLDDYVTINKLGINMDFSDYWASKAPAPAPAPAPSPGTGNTGGVAGNPGLA